jgi:peptidyl-prolyl cis-trans isomerase SurA
MLLIRTSVSSSLPALIVPLVMGLAACQSRQSTQAASGTPDTWALVDGRPITRADVDKAYDRNRDTAQQLSPEETTTMKLGLLDDLITQDILLARARELMIEVAESEIETAYQQARQSVPEEAFQQELARRNLTTSDLREQARRQLLVDKLLEREVGAKVSVSDQEVSDFFNANRAQFNLPEDAYHLAQIIITPVREQQLANRSGDDAATPQAAAAKTAMIMERLKAGASFGDLAMDYSEDPETAPRGGDLGLVPLSAVKNAPAPLRDAVLSAQPGNARVVTQNGAQMIVLVLSHQTAGQRDLSTPGTKDQITQALRARKEQLLRAAYLTSMRTKADVTNYLAQRVVESNGVPAAAAAPAPVLR